VENVRGQAASVSFSTKDFIRALSYRDFLTPFSLALLFIALREAIGYFSFVEWIDANSSLIIAAFMVLIALVNHIIYKIEHNRPNNFIGRCIQDIIFVFLVIIFLEIRTQIWNGMSVVEFNVGGVIGVTFGVAIFVTLFELVVAFLKRCLNYFKWRIL
jgi:hypothetical protein